MKTISAMPKTADPGFSDMVLKMIRHILRHPERKDPIDAYNEYASSPSIPPEDKDALFGPDIFANYYRADRSILSAISGLYPDDSEEDLPFS